MKILSLIFPLMLLSVPLATHAEIMPPDELIKTTVNDVLEIIKQDKRTKVAGNKEILEFIDAKILPHFNFERMTKLAVARDWRVATPEQKLALTVEFRTMLVRTYSKALTLYKDISVEIKPVVIVPSVDEVTVKTVILRPGAPPVPVDYEMEKTATGWKAFDVTVEGISLVATHRESFKQKVQQSGIDGLIQSLSELNKSAANPPVNKAEAK